MTVFSFINFNSLSLITLCVLVTWETEVHYVFQSPQSIELLIEINFILRISCLEFQIFKSFDFTLSCFFFKSLQFVIVLCCLCYYHLVILLIFEFNLRKEVWYFHNRETAHSTLTIFRNSVNCKQDQYCPHTAVLTRRLTASSFPTAVAD